MNTRHDSFNLAMSGHSEYAGRPIQHHSASLAWW